MYEYVVIPETSFYPATFIDTTMEILLYSQLQNISLVLGKYAAAHFHISSWFPGQQV